MANEKQQPQNETEHGGLRPSQADVAKALSGVRPDQELFQKGHRPLQEGRRPSQAQPKASLGPVAENPGSGVPPKKQ
jgi:hypothetical protein